MDVKKTVEFYLPHYEIIWPVWGALARVPINAPIILESCLNEKHSAKEKKSIGETNYKTFSQFTMKRMGSNTKITDF